MRKCYFFNAGLRGGSGCNAGDTRRFLHQHMSEQEYSTGSPAARTPSPKGKGKGEAGGRGGNGEGKGGQKPASPGQYCHELARFGRCPREEKFGVGKCIFSHKTQAQADAGKKAAAPAAPSEPATPAEGRAVPRRKATITAAEPDVWEFRVPRRHKMWRYVPPPKKEPIRFYKLQDQDPDTVHGFPLLRLHGRIIEQCRCGLNWGTKTSA